MYLKVTVKKGLPMPRLVTGPRGLPNDKETNYRIERIRSLLFCAGCCSAAFCPSCQMSLYQVIIN